MRVLLLVVGLLVGGALGFAVRPLMDPTRTFDYRVAFPDTVQTDSLSLGCTTVSQGSVYENRFDLTGNAGAGEGPDKLALNIADDGKSATVLYTYDVAHGSADPIPLRVLSKTTSYVVAAGQQTLGVTSVILDMKTRKAVVSYTGQGMLGIKASSLLLQCK